MLFCRFEPCFVAKNSLKVGYLGTGGRYNGNSEEFKSVEENNCIVNGQLMYKYCYGFEELKESVRQLLSEEDILKARKSIHEEVKVSRTIMEYIINVCLATRPPEDDNTGNPWRELHQYIRLGASPRGTESLLALSKSHAFSQGRDFVGFDDVNACAPHVLRHRILMNSQAISRNVTSEMIVGEILRTISPY